MKNPVIKECSYCLSHVPNLVRYGSKPQREIEKNPEILGKIESQLRDFKKAIGYPPNQVFIGNLSPSVLTEISKPWFKTPFIDLIKKLYERDSLHKDIQNGKFGEILSQMEFYALLKMADILEPPLFEISSIFKDKLAEKIQKHPLLRQLELSEFKASPLETIEEKISLGSALPIFSKNDGLIGCFCRDNRAEGKEDENLSAHHLLENLCTKASGALALLHLLHKSGLKPQEIDFIISCGEEACGDRYQRGGGGMAKAIGEMCGCTDASGTDIKNFCAAPASAIITAGALIKAGIHKNIIIVGGGSLAKLGMKLHGYLENNIPILEDCLASMAFLISENDGKSPVIRLNAIGKAPIGASASDEEVYKNLILEPLKTLGLKITDIDKYAPELQNPEIMEFAGSGDVAMKNYRKIAAMAVKNGEITKPEMKDLIQKIGMPGFAATQGHIPSAVPYLGHAIEAMKRNEIKRVMFLAKASLFLGRCTPLFDGVSFIIEKQQ